MDVGWRYGGERVDFGWKSVELGWNYGESGVEVR